MRKIFLFPCGNNATVLHNNYFLYSFKNKCYPKGVRLPEELQLTAERSAVTNLTYVIMGK